MKPHSIAGQTDLAVGLDAVLEAVELPAGISDLDASLAEVNRLQAEAGKALERVGRMIQRGGSRTAGTSRRDSQ